MVFVADAPLQWLPRHTIRRTQSVVWENIPTQSTEREGTKISMENDNELDVPILDFMKTKKNTKNVVVYI